MGGCGWSLTGVDSILCAGSTKASSFSSTASSSCSSSIAFSSSCVGVGGGGDGGRDATTSGGGVGGMTSGTSGGGLLVGVISLSILDRCLGGGDLSFFPSGFFSAAFSSSVGVFDHCNVSMTLDSVLRDLCLVDDRGLCRSAVAERDILTFICSSRSGEGGSSLGSGGGVISLSGEGRADAPGLLSASPPSPFPSTTGRVEKSRAGCLCPPHRALSFPWPTSI